MSDLEYDCYSSNGEDFQEDFDCIVDDLLSDCKSIEEAFEATLYTAVSKRPTITGNWLANTVAGDIYDRLHQAVGEYADNYTISQADYAELEEFLTKWIDKQDFRCYRVENIKEIKLTDILELEDIKNYFS